MATTKKTVDTTANETQIANNEVANEVVNEVAIVEDEDAKSERLFWESESVEVEKSENMRSIWERIKAIAKDLSGLNPATQLKKMLDKSGELLQAKNDRVKELAAIAAHEADLREKELISNALQVLRDFEDVVQDEMRGLLQLGESPNEDQKAVLNAIAQRKYELREIISNKLIASINKVRVPKVASEGGEVATNGERGKVPATEIVAAYLDAIAKGVTNDMAAYLEKALPDAPKSSIWHAIDRYTKANNLQKVW